jgi:hypothetical protein
LQPGSRRVKSGVTCCFQASKALLLAEKWLCCSLSCQRNSGAPPAHHGGDHIAGVGQEGGGRRLFAAQLTARFQALWPIWRVRRRRRRAARQLVDREQARRQRQARVLGQQVGGRWAAMGLQVAAMAPEAMAKRVQARTGSTSSCTS